MYKDSWDVMRRGDVERALWQMQDNFEKEWNTDYSKPTCTSEAMALGVAYLWLNDYRAASKHFQRFNEHFPHHAAPTYAMAGVANWCLGMPEDAIAEWEDGLKAEYVDWAGGVTLPLLLFFATAVRPGVFEEFRAEELLSSRINGPNIEIWPGPLAKFVMGRMDIDAVRRAGVHAKREHETLLHCWQCDFWLGVMEHTRGNVSRYRDLMRKVGRLDWSDYDESTDLFLGKLWNPAFFLARHEAFEV